jgi:hypothetical protein
MPRPYPFVLVSVKQGTCTLRWRWLELGGDRKVRHPEVVQDVDHEGVGFLETVAVPSIATAVVAAVCAETPRAGQYEKTLKTLDAPGSPQRVEVESHLELLPFTLLGPNEM